MKKLLTLLLLLASPCWAQTAQQSQVGNLQPVNGRSTFVPISTSNPLPVNIGTSSILCPTCVDGDLLIGNSATGGFSVNTLTQGSGITITNGHGTITIAASGANVSSFSAGTTGFTPNSPTTGAVVLDGILIGANGGTGIANTGKTITIGGNLVTSGAFPSTFTMTGTTSVTFPTSGTLATTSGLTNISIGTSISATNPQISGDTSSGLYTPSGSTVAIAIAGTQRAVWSSNGQTIVGSLNTTGTRVVKGWFTDLEITNPPTIGGSAIAFSNLAGQATNSQLATQTANTVLGALTATTPSGLALPSCTDSAGNHLNYTSGTGFSCGTTSSKNGTVTSVTFTGDGTVLSSTPSSVVTTSGTVTAALANAGAGTVLGNITSSAAAPTYTSVPVLGKSGTTQGSITLDGLTSGALIITTQSTAGIPTWTAGTSSGTPAVTASSPLVITSATGNITCPTCNTSSANVNSVSGDSFLISNSVSTGAVTLAQANHTANSVTGALTATTLSDLAVPSCSTASSALKWTSGTGFGCNSSITASTNANLTGPITSSGNATTVAYIGGAVAIGTTSAASAGTIFDMGNSANASLTLLLPSGTTGQRPGTGINGMIRYNSTATAVEAYQNNAWTAFGSGAGTVTSIATTSPITGGTITSTGTIACATCATTTNGGALSGTAPIAVSAAGVISLTNPLPVANGGTNATSASITAFNNITGYTAAGATGTTSTNLVFSTAPTISQPNLVGTTTNNNAAAGSVGEYISSSVAQGSAVGVTSVTAADITSISLTAGDWDLWGQVNTNNPGGTIITITEAYITSASATRSIPPNGGAYVFDQATKGIGTNYSYSVGMTRLSLSGTTTIYLGVFSQFSGSTNGYYGFLGARRVR